jgi:hypothetical protein
MKVTQVLDADWGGVQVVFDDGSKAAVTTAHWDAICAYSRARQNVRRRAIGKGGLRG